MIPSFRPTFQGSDIKAALLLYYGVVEQFEEELRDYFGMDHAITFPYGRSALYTALKAIEKARGEVIQPAYNCVVVAHATVTAGHYPAFIDTLRESPLQDPQKMVDAVSSQTVAIIPTSIFGMTFDVGTLCEAIYRRNKNAHIFMDCCQCFDARWKGELMARYGDAAFLAFGIGKPMTTLYGGALLTNRPDLAKSVRAYRDTYFRKRPPMAVLKRWIYFLSSWIGLSPSIVPFTDWMVRADTPLKRYLLKLRARASIQLPGDNQVFMHPMEAAIGRVQLRRVPGFMKRRQEIALVYNQEFQDLSKVVVLPWHEGSSYAIYTLKIKNPENRSRILMLLRRFGVLADTTLNYVIPGLDCYRLSGYTAEPFSHANHWAQSVLNLPNHPSMTDNQVHTVIQAVKYACGDVYA